MHASVAVALFSWAVSATRHQVPVSLSRTNPGGSSGAAAVAAPRTTSGSHMAMGLRKIGLNFKMRNSSPELLPIRTKPHIWECKAYPKRAGFRGCYGPYLRGRSVGCPADGVRPAAGSLARTTPMPVLLWSPISG